jgi:hypothetical protein
VVANRTPPAHERYTVSFEARVKRPMWASVRECHMSGNMTSLLVIASTSAGAWLTAGRHDFSSGWLGLACLVSALGVIGIVRGPLIGPVFGNVPLSGSVLGVEHGDVRDADDRALRRL